MKSSFMILAGLCIAITAQGAAAQNDPWAAKDWETLRAQLIAHADETGDPVSALLLNPSNFDTDVSVGSAIYLDRSTSQVDSVYDSSAFRSINVVIAAMSRIYFRDQVQADGTIVRKVRAYYRADCDKRRVMFLGSYRFSTFDSEEIEDQPAIDLTQSARWDTFSPGSTLDIALQSLCDGRSIYDPAG